MSNLILNFNGKVAFNGIDITGQSVELFFPNTLVNLSVSAINKEYTNIYGDLITIRKGFVYEASIKIYLPTNYLVANNPYLTNLNKLREILSVISLEKAVYLNFYSPSNILLKSITFDQINSSLNYTDFFNGNSKLGLEISIKLKRNYSDENILEVWEATTTGVVNNG